MPDHAWDAVAVLMMLCLQQRTPLEVAAEDIRGHLHFSRPGGVFVWGSGANYQLGTGSTENRAVPSRLDAFGGEAIVAVAAAKYHSAAVNREGKLYTWGWGHGGRLGHADFAGEGAQRLMAQIQPQPVAGLARQRVTSVAAAKHHTLACTAEGYVYAWGSNRHGRLGFSGVDSSWTPRRVGHLKHAIVCVSAANKHSAALSPCGCVYTWGDNTQVRPCAGTHACVACGGPCRRPTRLRGYRGSSGTGRMAGRAMRRPASWTRCGTGRWRR